MRLEFHLEAFSELQASAQYYESRRPGLGTRFLNLVDDALERIARDPYAWILVEGDIRRCLTRVFPFGIYYSLEPDFVLILAVAHLAREPGYWKSRR